jgi:hypothetical protein
VIAAFATSVGVRGLGHARRGPSFRKAHTPCRQTAHLSNESERHIMIPVPPFNFAKMRSSLVAV